MSRCALQGWIHKTLMSYCPSIKLLPPGIASGCGKYVDVGTAGEILDRGARSQRFEKEFRPSR
jgi:hypothetical protein